MSWWRVEGSCRDSQVAEGLAARVADPLWALARQWQVGEFVGEDAASPIVVTADVAHTTLSTFAQGHGKEKGVLDHAVKADRPLEVLVEQETVDDDVRLRLEQGWLLLRRLAAAGVSKAAVALARYKIVLATDDGWDAVGRGQIELLARRSIDGLRLAAELSGAGSGVSQTDPAAVERAIRELVGDLGVPPAQTAAVGAIVSDWLDRVQQFIRLPQTQSCWRTEPLEYQFRVAAALVSGEVSLSASEYRGGSLDWFHFKRAAGDTLGAEGKPQTRSITVLPTPLRFHGMPAARFWTIEDDLVSFGDLIAGPEDFVRAVVGAFAAVYADDWMVVPCVLPVGSLSRIEKLTVYDDYGQTHEIKATAVLDGPDRVWRWFEIEGDEGPNAPTSRGRRAPIMLLAPRADVEEGPPLERVDFVRDQVANLAWAIERQALGASGRPVDRDAASALPELPQSDRDWSYHAYSPVRANWIPFTPVQMGEGASAQVHLRRGLMALPPPGMEPNQLLPIGRLLDASAPMRVQEEAIADAGLRIDRRYQRTRGADGRVHLWVGRRVRTGAWPARGQFIADRLIRSGPAVE